MPTLQLSFNGTFALKKKEVIKILEAAQEEKGLKDSRQGLVDRTGLGNEKVSRIKGWASRSGLIGTVHLSKEGEIIVKKDPGLESVVTDWVMHSHLTFGSNGFIKPPEDAAEWGGWSWFTYTFLPENTSFRLENLIYEAGEIFKSETSAGLKKNLRHVLRAYTESEALESCQFLQKADGGKYFAGEAVLPNPYLICYFLAKIWERDYGKTMSVITDEVLNHKMGLAPVLGLESAALQEQLNKLEAFGLIEQRRTVPPFQIIRRWDSSLSLLEQAYAHTE